MKTWWRCRKYFKFPGVTFYFVKNYVPFVYHKWNEGKNILSRIIFIQYVPLQWKIKNELNCFEQEPFIDIEIFRRWHFGIRFSNGKYNLDAYWEAILDHLYDGKSLSDSVSDNSWKRTNGEFENAYTQRMLTLRGMMIYENEIIYENHKRQLQGNCS